MEGKIGEQPLKLEPEDRQEPKSEFVEINEGNIDEVANLVSAIHMNQKGRTPLSPEQAKEEITKHSEENQIASALLQDSRTIGFAWMHELVEDKLEGPSLYLKFFFGEGRKVFYVDDVGVAEESQRKGFGKEIMENLLNKGKQAGATTITLSTRPSGKKPEEKMPAYELYKKVGFSDLVEQPPIGPRGSKKFYMAYEYKDKK